ncbi:aminotransferase class III-fold pyridoxal phosphate-dependent enzyme [Croceitalea sp. P059]|uniref:aminotransferase class III-fold pyridoxal phosphate-dependent enzyme n=1 Tax=Croceitalea sp. P059 TaxID=3075601 RepID=UPI0028860BBE|nr:aminotransferase class III-fold pyridoxal phosphate-dependent enzyme [Croceitalea sp. P059]MDT0539791.1 aminotransferase class III-fold pyridoxal phosphate-dependent enzyme [Croceitalea sp. P059]
MISELQQLLELEFGLKNPSIKKINGYDNANYRVQSKEKSFVLKTYTFDDELFEVLKAENEVLLLLNSANSECYPKPMSFNDNQFIKLVKLNGERIIIRMLTFLDGIFLGDLEANKKVYQSLGSSLAKMNLALSEHSSTALKARKWEWDLQYFELNKKYLNAIQNPKDRSLVAYFFKQYEVLVTPVLPHLRKQVIHNDANEWNVLTTAEAVTGFIDFGDLAYAPLINEVAIAMTYAAYDKENSLEYASIVLAAYHEVLFLFEEEISLLYYLMAARLSTSVCNSAYAKQQQPENSYASISEENAWITLEKWIALNPIHVENTFRVAAGFSPKKAISIDLALEKRSKHISSILSVSYKKPIQMESAAFQYMYDVHGNVFLDAYNNIPHVGHSHPKVIEAGQKQMAKLNTNTRYVYDLLAIYAEKLVSKFPDGLNKVFFVNSGSAASDLAIRMAKNHTGKSQVLVMEHGYHGNTQTSIDISDYKFNNKKGQGQKDYILKTALPDAYRGKHGNNGPFYVKDLQQEMSGQLNNIAAFITEPVVGCGGQIPLAKDYLKHVYPEIRKHGGVCISDEVQTGFGRLGDKFWGFELHDVVPDIVVLGKPMGNSHPIGAVVVTDEIAASFENGVEFFSSFGGNPVSCAIGLAVLEVIEEESLQENAKEVGDYYQQELKKLQQKHAVIGDVRGSGLFIGIDIVHAGTKNTNYELAQHIKNELRQKHILISTDGPDDSVLKTKPPLCFTKANVDTVVSAINTILLKNQF